MSVKGKRRDEWVAQTLTDFGDPNRRDVLRRHFSVEAGHNSFKGILKIYGRDGVRLETDEGEILLENMKS